MPEPKSPIVKWFYENEMLGWIGLALGLAGLVASPIFGFTTAAGIIALIVGGALVGLAVAYWISKPPKHPLVCVRSAITCDLNGPRGKNATRVEHARFKAKADLQAFVYAMKKHDGIPAKRQVRYRNLGQGGRASHTPEWITLGKDHIFESATASGHVSLMIQPPWPIRNGDIFEIHDLLEVDDAFPADDEHVGKNLLYPTDVLVFEITFIGSQAENAFGTI